MKRLIRQFNRYFPVLSVISILLQVLGGLWVILGIPTFFLALVLVEEESMRRTLLFGSATTVLSGLVALAIGEVIGILFAIEANTRKAADAMQAAASTVPVQR